MKKRNLKNKKNTNRVIIILLIIFGISVAYAIVSTQLKINGSAVIKKQTWNVYWANPVVSSGSKSMTLPTIGNDGSGVNNKLSWSITLDYPGEYYEFNIDAVNAGTIDAVIESINLETTPQLPNYIAYSIIDSTGHDVVEGTTLLKADGSPTVETYKIRIEYDKEYTTGEVINEMASSNNSYAFNLTLTYGQLDEVNADSCPGKNCVYAFSSEGDSIHTATSDGYENYFAGVTNDYRLLNLEFDEYKSCSSEGCQYYYSPYSSESDVHLGKVKVKPKTFQGYILDESSNIKNKYVCGIYSSKLYCINEKFYDTDNKFVYTDEIYDILVGIYGEYDSSNNTGCRKYDESVECISSDETQVIKYSYDEDYDIVKIYVRDLYNYVIYGVTSYNGSIGPFRYSEDDWYGLIN